MKLEKKVNLGGYNSMGFQSSEHPTPQECARDLIQQMEAMSSVYPILKTHIMQLKGAYNV